MNPCWAQEDTMSRYDAKTPEEEADEGSEEELSELEDLEGDDEDDAESSTD